MIKLNKSKFLIACILTPSSSSKKTFLSIYQMCSRFSRNSQSTPRKLNGYILCTKKLFFLSILPLQFIFGAYFFSTYFLLLIFYLKFTYLATGRNGFCKIFLGSVPRTFNKYCNRYQLKFQAIVTISITSNSIWVLLFSFSCTIVYIIIFDP